MTSGEKNDGSGQPENPQATVPASAIDSGPISDRPLPRVSFAIPVRNGERFLGRALDSLLAQDFDDFEIVVCDNASTDKTPEVMRRYAERDRRVRCTRNEEDIGQIENFNRVYELARGEFFRWMGADDWLEPDIRTQMCGGSRHAPGRCRRHDPVALHGRRGTRRVHRRTRATCRCAYPLSTPLPHSGAAAKSPGAALRPHLQPDPTQCTATHRVAADQPLDRPPLGGRTLPFGVFLPSGRLSIDTAGRLRTMERTPAPLPRTPGPETGSPRDALRRLR